MEKKEEPDSEDQEMLKELEGESFHYDKTTHSCEVKTGPSDGAVLFQEVSAGKGDEFRAVRPWLGAIIPPTQLPPKNLTVPAENYVLEHVYGYRSFDCRQNAYFTATGKVAFHAAAVGVVLDLASNKQTFFGGVTPKNLFQRAKDQHDSSILCLAISQDRKTVATGQVGAKPMLMVWDADTCKLKGPKSFYIATEKETRAIRCCAFSSDGNFVAFVDKHNDHNVKVLDIKTGALPLNKKGGAQDTLDVAWNKVPGDLTFATCGVKHIRFWNLKDGTSKLGTGHGAQTFSCVTYGADGTCYAGGLKGEIFLFKGSSLSGKIAAHSGLVQTLNWVGGQLLSGGSDRKLNVFGPGGKVQTSVALPSVARAIDKFNDTILVGLRNGSIAIVTASGAINEVLKSHHDGEVWGLDLLDSGEVLTTADDNKIMRWDPVSHKCIGVYQINDKDGPRIKYGASSLTALPDNKCSRAICYNTKTKDVAIATNAGEVQIRTLANMNAIKKSINCAPRWIECMAYSPDGKILAVGTHSSYIAVYDATTYAQKAQLTGHTSSLLSLDWSDDSSYIRSVCESYELLFFSMATMKQDPSGATATKDMAWHTQRTKFGWHVQGIFPPGTDGSYINGVDRSEDRKLIVTGDDSSHVNIYRNPCLEGSAPKILMYVLSANL